MRRLVGGARRSAPRGAPCGSETGARSGGRPLCFLRVADGTASCSAVVGVYTVIGVLCGGLYNTPGGLVGEERVCVRAYARVRASAVAGYYHQSGRRTTGPRHRRRPQLPLIAGQHHGVSETNMFVYTYKD